MVVIRGKQQQATASPLQSGSCRRVMLASGLFISIGAVPAGVDNISRIELPLDSNEKGTARGGYPLMRLEGG